MSRTIQDDVSNIEVYDSGNNLITILDTVRSQSLVGLPNKYYFIIKNAVENSEFTEYLKQNSFCYKGVIIDTHFEREVMTVDYTKKPVVNKYEVKLRQYKKETECDGHSIVTIVFEITKIFQ
jgi:hypothetical protein